jgi:hypothetical protein
LFCCVYFYEPYSFIVSGTCLIHSLLFFTLALR